jgi:amino acid permease
VRAAVIGGSGADLVVGRASTRGTYQSVLSKKLKPPAKWSYRKLIFWSALVFVCGGWLVFYINTVTTNASTISSTALGAYAAIASVIFALILLLVLRHNLTVYPKRSAEWGSSFICQRCGAVSEQDH